MGFSLSDITSAPGKLLSGTKDFFLGEQPDTDVRNLDTMTPEQKEALKQLLAQLSGQLGQGGEAFTGERVAPLSPSEQFIHGTIGPGVRDDRATFENITSELTPLLSGGDVDVEPFFNETIRDPLLETFFEEEIPGLDRSFAKTDFFSTDRNQGVTDVASDLNTILGRELTRLSFDTQQAGLDRAVDVGGLLAALPGQRAQSTAIAEESARTPRLVEQANLEAEFQEFLRIRKGGTDQNQTIQQLLQALGLGASENVVTTTPGTSGFLSDFLTGGGGEVIGTQIGKRFPGQ